MYSIYQQKEDAEHFWTKTTTDEVSHSAANKIVELLSQLLNNTYSLALKTFNYHWNLKGKSFEHLFNMTKEQYDDLLSAIQPIAEQIRNLGYEVPETYTKINRLSEINFEDFTENEIIEELTNNHLSIIKLIHNEINYLQTLGRNQVLFFLRKRLKKHQKAISELNNMKSSF